MKKLVLSLAILLLCLSITFSLVYARGTTKGRDQNLQNVIIPLIKQGYDIDKEKSLIGVLDRGTSINYMIPLYSGVQYVIVAAGDETTQDIDIKVRDEDGKIVAIDKSTFPTAVIKISPKWTGPFYVDVIMTKCRDNDAHYISLYAQKD